MKIPLLEEIEVALYKHYNMEICMPTVTMFFEHEIDFLTIRKKTGYVAEVEIKRSLSDMKAENKKNHNHNSDKIAELYFCFPRVLSTKCEPFVPDRAGILEVYWTGFNWKIALVRRAKRNTKARPLTKKEIDKILRYSNYRIWGLKKKIVKLQNRLKKYEQQGKKTRN